MATVIQRVKIVTNLTYTGIEELLKEGWLMRFATADDAARLKKDQGIKSKGKGGTVEGHVSGDHGTKYISAARTQGGARRYIAGNQGVMLINPTIAKKHGATIHDTDWVVANCTSKETQENAGKAREYLFELSVPGEAIIYSETIPKQQFELPKSRRPVAGEAASSDEGSISSSEDEDEPEDDDALIGQLQNKAYELSQETKASRQAGIKRAIVEIVEKLRSDFDITLQNSNKMQVIKFGWDVPDECFQ